MPLPPAVETQDAANDARLNARDYSQLGKGELYFSFALVSSLFFLWGLSYGLVDVLNKHFLDVFDLTKTQSTLLQFAYFVSYLIAAPPMSLFMRRFGYKAGIHVGLALFSIGAILFWPAAVYKQYGMFVGFTFIIASGLATLEVAANAYILVLGPPKYAALRLVLAQGFNGIATVIGPLIASNTFFSGKNADAGELGTVQYVYLALACFGVLLNVFFFFVKLPEVKQAVDMRPVGKFGKQFRLHFGVVAQFFYVGAQVAVASNAVFYMVEQPGISPAYSAATGSNLFSGCQAAFTVGRFVGVWYLKYIDPAFALFVSGIFMMLFSILTSTIDGIGGIVCLYFVFFFESISYPVIFSIASADLGRYYKLGAGMLAVGVSGGAVYPSMQAAVGDKAGTQVSYMIPFTGFFVLTAYALVMWRSRSIKHHRPWSIWLTERDLIVEGADGGSPVKDGGSGPLDDKFDPNVDERREYADERERPGYVGSKN